jgi:hypothetical protein
MPDDALLDRATRLLAAPEALLPGDQATALGRGILPAPEAVLEERPAKNPPSGT